MSDLEFMIPSEIKDMGEGETSSTEMNTDLYEPTIRERTSLGSRKGASYTVRGPPMGSRFSPPIATPWKTHLFDCLQNPQNAAITLIFPCVTFGQIAEILDDGSTSCVRSGIVCSLFGCCIGMPCRYRSKLRAKFHIVDDGAAPDWVIHCICHHCALSQEYRELQHRGLDPSIGHAGNVAKQQQIGTTPPMHQRMM